VSGSIVGPLGEAIPGVDLDLYFAGTANQVLLSGDVTAIDGTFTFTVQELIPAGFYDIHLNPPAGAEYFPTVLANQFLGGPTTLPSPITLDPASILTGQVVDELGVGLPEVDLNFFDPITGVESIFSGDITDAFGFFEVRVAPAMYDIEFRPTATTPGGPFVPVFLSDRPLTASLDVGIVVFEDAEVLTGTVNDPLGAPLAGCDIDVVDPLTGFTVYTPGDFTDASGVFTVFVPDGSWRVEIDPPTGAPLVSKLLDVAVFPGVAKDVGVVTLPSGLAVSGTTVQGVSTPVPDVDLDFVISATGIEIPTAHDNANGAGEFSVRVEPDTYDIQFRPPFITGLAPVVLAAVPVTADLNLGLVTLPPGPALTGTVTAAGLPVEGVEVTLTDSATGSPVYTFGNDTDALGAYGLRQIPGTYDVTFTPPPGSPLAPVTVPGVTLTTDTVLDQTLAPGSVPPPVTALLCSSSGADAILSWTPGAPDYDAVEIARDGAAVASLPGTATGFTDAGLAAGVYDYTVVPVRGGLAAVAAPCSVTVVGGPSNDFVRGDPNDSGAVDISDVVLTLEYLFNANSSVRCVDALDANDSGQVNIADAIYTLGYLFGGQAPPLPPFPGAGPDPTADALPDCT